MHQIPQRSLSKINPPVSNHTKNQSRCTRRHRIRILAGLSLRPSLSSTAGFDFACFGPLDVVSWDPFSIKGLRRWSSFTSSFVSRVGRSGSGLFRVVGLALLREVWGDPESVEEVESTGRAAKQEEVEEESTKIQ